MKLFDDIAELSDSSDQHIWSRPPALVWLGQSNKPHHRKIKERLEDWFSHYPDGAEKLRLWSEFRDNEKDYISAFTELAIHELCLRLDYQLTPHPDGAKRRPDFHVLLPSGNSFVLEVTTVTQYSPQSRAARKVRAWIYDTINKCDTDGLQFIVNIRAYGSRTPSKRLISMQIGDALCRYRDTGSIADPCDDVSGFSSDNMTLRLDDWIIILIRLPIKSDLNSSDEPIAVEQEISNIDAWRRIRKSIEKKQPRDYCHKDIPFILAINSMALGSDVGQYYNALFGERCLLYDPAAAMQDKFARRSDGLWWNGARWLDKRYSAILGISGFQPFAPMHGEAILMHHPEAYVPIDGVFNDLPQGQLQGDQYCVSEGSKLYQLLGIPEGWPEMRGGSLTE
jgi:hypothetical protein